MASKLKGKCKEYIENELCLGCERLAIPTFTGDDNCPYIKEREELESWIRKTRRDSMK